MVVDVGIKNLVIYNDSLDVVKIVDDKSSHSSLFNELANEITGGWIQEL